MVTNARAWLCALLLLWAPLASANLDVQPQRQSMALGETLGLVISSNSGLDLGQLDLSPLETDFQILSRSSSTSISVVNGARTDLMTLNLELSPRRSGQLQIPALSLNGHTSQPAMIEVSPAPTTNPSLDRSRDLILEVEVDSETPYVQQQVRYTVKLYFAISLTEGNLSEPGSDSALIERVGQDASYRTQIQGRTYQVVERHYALTPQSSGTLQIPPVTLNGRLANGRGFFDRGQPVSVASRTVELQVKPRPASFTAEPWLPARSLALTEDLSAATARVGEPLTRTLTLAAVGLPQSLLPELSMAPGNGYQVYPDQPSRSGNSQDGWLISQLEQKIAVVPSRPGPLRLPALEVSWWDVGSDQLKTARIAERVIEVLPASNAQASAPTLPATSEPAQDSPTPLAVETRTVISPGYWPWVSALFAMLWLGTLAAWLIGGRRGSPAKTDDSRSSLDVAAASRALQKACKQNEAAAAEDAVVKLFQARGGILMGSAMALAEVLPPGPARAALIDLDRARFANAAEKWSGAALADCIDQIAPLQSAQQRKDQTLPPLYAGSAR